MDSRLRLLITVVVISLSINKPAWASGADGPEDSFVSRTQPDIDFDQYESGSLGIILPTYPRVFLYPAWRAILLGKEVLHNEKTEVGSLNKACCLYSSGWINELDSNTPQAKWLKTRATIVPTKPRMRLAIEKRIEAGSYSYFRNCSDSSYLFAQSTLQEISKRPDVTPARVKEWVNAQDAVFEFCGYIEGEKQYGVQKEITPPTIPTALSIQESKFWRQLREYQIAAAYFYSGDMDNAISRFQAIGLDTSHPMHDWGEYLALRASIRQITLNSGVLISQDHPELEEKVTNILKNPVLSKVHVHANASLRLIKARLAPENRLEELSVTLNDWKRNPHIDDTLADWKALANKFLDDEKSPLIEPMRISYEYFDWMRTIQRCNGNLPATKLHTCEAESIHALEKWHEAIKMKRPQAKAWLVAVLMTANHLNDDVMEQARKVPENAPEYSTVQYFLIKNMRVNKQVSQARQLSETQLKKPIVSRSALNLFLQERFAVSTDLEDAAQYLTRSIATYGNPDTKETIPTEKLRTTLALDGTNWLNNHLATVDLLRLSKLEVLPQALRTRIALAAWVRADLLNKPDLAKQAVNILEKLQPSLNSITSAYLNAKDRFDRQHVLLVAEVSGYQISPIVSWDGNSTYAYKAGKEENAIADMWCDFGKNDQIWNWGDTHPIALPDLSTDIKVRDSELVSLSKIGSATGYFGKHVIAYAQAYPTDPQNPWLLHVVVVSTRGGCVDKNNREISQQAYTLLHRKYNTSEWAKKTPYWY